MKEVAVLFARADSCYKRLPGCDVWDFERDALAWPGGAPIVAHPPCRAWGQLRALANPRPGEKELAPWAVEQVRKWGGVLEHPRRSTLWRHVPLPAPGQVDEYGGWTLPIYQIWWGHRAEKPTYLYIVGCRPGEVPVMPLYLGTATHVVGASGRRPDGTRLLKGHPDWRPECGKAERERTPPALAEWLVELARRCHV